jgi:hypothetical protein
MQYVVQGFNGTGWDNLTGTLTSDGNFSVPDNGEVFDLSANTTSYSIYRILWTGGGAVQWDPWIDEIEIASCNPTDTDGDGISDDLDLDSDNDGIPDITEAGGTDTDADGRVDNATDTDGDGWANTFDSDNGGTALDDGDQDGDGLENRIDLDADNDGIADIIEAGGEDNDGDGRADSNSDLDGDGLSDTFDNDNLGTPLPVEDEDGDGIENYLDLDSDSDGIADNLEAQTTAAFLAPLGTDGDNDGWDDRYDSDNGGTAITLSNNEGFRNPDYLDDDSDGDGFPDWQEGFDDDEDGDAQNDLEARADAFETAAGNPLLYVNTDDADNDGLPNWLEDDDADNVPNFLDPDNAFYQDTDGDGTVDLYDTDNNGTVASTPDTDADGEYDFRDTDNQISLPVELIGFNAVAEGERSKLIWATESELNNDYFLIERAGEDREFKVIAQVDGAGNSNRRLDYFTYDENPLEGNNYYRLKQVDYNGEYSYSQIEVLQYKSETMDASLYPNPTNGEQLFLNVIEPKPGKYTLRVLSSEGKVMLVRELSFEEETLYFELELLNRLELSSGTYFVVIQSLKELKTLPFVVR